MIYSFLIHLFISKFKFIFIYKFSLQFLSLCVQLCSLFCSPKQSLSGVKNQVSFRKKKKRKKKLKPHEVDLYHGRHSLLFIRVALKFCWRFAGILYWQPCYQPLVKYSCNVSGEYPSSNLYGNPGDSRIYRRGVRRANIRTTSQRKHASCPVSVLM